MKFWKIAFLFAASAFSNMASANMDEFDNCNAPEEIIFIKENIAYINTLVNMRYEKYPGGVLSARNFKNPEFSSGNGPAHFQNCTNASNIMMTHRIRFWLKTENFFGYNGMANHLAIALRGNFARQFGVDDGDQIGRGIAAFPWNQTMDYSGTKFEKFDSYNYSEIWPNYEHSFTFSDNQWYQVELRASPTWIRLIVWDQYGVLLHDRDTPVPNGSDPTSTGFGVGVLCKDYSSCEYPQNHPYFTQQYKVHMNNIQIDWKYDSQFGY